MGYGTRNNGQIKTFWPDDTENEFYIAGSATIEDITKRCREKWGWDFDWSHIRITPEHIHTDCLTYDLYDSGDWTHFLCITKEGP